MLSMKSSLGAVRGPLADVWRLVGLKMIFKCRSVSGSGGGSGLTWRFVGGFSV